MTAVRKLLIFKTLVFAALVIGASLAAFAQIVIDKTVATVDDGVGSPELITYSDLVWVLALQPGTPIDPPSSEDLNRALELLINQRLIAIEAKRLPSAPPTDETRNREINRILALFPSTAEFENRLRNVGFESVKDDNFERMMDERVKIEQYLEFRFRSFVVIAIDSEQRYYNEVFAPDFRRRYPGLLMPPFEDKRLEINEILTEERVADSLEQFLDNAKQRAQIVILSPV